MMAWVNWRKVTMRISDNPKTDMEKAYTIALNAIDEFPEWTTPKALADLIELFLKKYDEACGKIHTLLTSIERSFRFRYALLRKVIRSNREL